MEKGRKKETGGEKTQIVRRIYPLITEIKAILLCKRIAPLKDIQPRNARAATLKI